MRSLPFKRLVISKCSKYFMWNCPSIDNHVFCHLICNVGGDLCEADLGKHNILLVLATTIFSEFQ